MKDKLLVSLDSLLHLVLTLPYLRYKDIIVGLLALAAELFLSSTCFSPLLRYQKGGHIYRVKE